MSTYAFNEARGGTPHAKYLRFADAAVGLRGKKVLEVGGCSPPQLVAKYGPSRWDCVNLDSTAVESFNAMRASAGLAEGSASTQDATSFEVSTTYDVVYSINAFEHIKPLPRALECIRAALAEDGYLFSLFGPIWSCDVGHHLSVMTDAGELHFQDGVLKPWEHLTARRAEIHARLEKKYGARAADRVIEFVFDYPDLNRVHEHEYLDMFARSGLSQVLLLRNKSGGRPPVAQGGGAARELMVVLKKGRKSFLESEVRLARFAVAFARQRFNV
jgi:SAM-dependent methyltransferase